MVTKFVLSIPSNLPAKSDSYLDLHLAIDNDGLLRIYTTNWDIISSFQLSTLHSYEATFQQYLPVDVIVTTVPDAVYKEYTSCVSYHDFLDIYVLHIVLIYKGSFWINDSL